jgi:hypothetical protein
MIAVPLRACVNGSKPSRAKLIVGTDVPRSLPGDGTPNEKIPD